jgi:hypothetical protein
VDPIDQILGLLSKILRDPPSRKETVREFEQYYDRTAVRGSIRREVLDILDELAYDLNFYVADPASRAQDPGYYGDERLMREIESTLRLLSQVGVIVPQRG